LKIKKKERFSMANNPNTPGQNNDADGLYGAINKHISDTGFEFAMQDGRIDDGEWAQIAARAGVNGASVETLVALKARFEQSWKQEHKDGPDKNEQPHEKEAKEEGKKMVGAGASKAEEASSDKSFSASVTTGKGKGQAPGVGM
jgi:hypothetical protein